ncbi:MAG: hypothetical protein ACJAXT_000099 [Paracoccaceae bacterium]|jgi:hypothetical protein
MRIAMWSGPRNLSTAMMYSFAARPDFTVMDEPFYACYLQKTGLNHPMRAEVLAAQSTDPDDVIAQLLAAAPPTRPHIYQKHMTQHMVPGIPRDWFDQVRHVFLIRHPSRVAASFGAKYENPTLEDLGFLQQVEIYQEVCAMGIAPIVIDSTDIRRDPEGALKGLCTALALNWEPSMLGWPSGGHPSDGIWAAHWYGAVHRSTGFAGAEAEMPQLGGTLAELAAQALPSYQKLAAVKLG